jgi:protein involved in polysaccharide export with SLBB domain
LLPGWGPSNGRLSKPITKRYFAYATLLLLTVACGRIEAQIYADPTLQSGPATGVDASGLGTAGGAANNGLGVSSSNGLQNTTCTAQQYALDGCSSNMMNVNTQYSSDTVKALAGTYSSPLDDQSLNSQRYGNSLPRSIPVPPDELTEFQRFVAATTGHVLPIYGTSLFRNVPSTFAPIDLAPVTADYVIGPEDELRVRIWGQFTYTGNLRVDRSGDIYLPQVGTVHVAGLPFSGLDQRLRAAVSKMYRNFDLSVDVGRIRSMQVYVTGQARRPGVYTVSSLSTLVDTLFASGGPSTQGSMRHIQVKRAGKVVADFDLYALLVSGDKSHDERLLPEDVLFIPPVGAQVAITGSVRMPGIYELIEGETIGALIDTAGKTSTLASDTRISIDRSGADQVREAMEIPFDATGLAAKLSDGDILRINPVVAAYQKTVTLRGNVANPGRFSFHAGMKLSDLIPDRDSLVSRDYWWKRSHLGLPVPEFEPLITTLGRPQVPETAGNGFTTAVSPDTLTKAMTPRDADTDRALEEQYAAGGQNLQNLQAAAAMQNDPAHRQTGAGSGTIGSQNATGTLTTNPGQLSSKTVVRLVTPEIDWDYAVIERLDPLTLKTSLIPFDLGKLVLQHDAAQDLALQPGDTVTIFSQADIHVPLETQTKYVDVEGEVVHAGMYSVQPGETLRDVVRRAGGFTSDAYLYGSEFDRESTRVLQQHRLDDYVQEVSAESERGTQALAVAGASGTNSSSDVANSRLITQDIVARLSRIRATGRVVFAVTPGHSSVNDVPAIALENGDKFMVPPMPATVNVVGAVYNQNSFLFVPGRTVGSYMKLAGGVNRSADSARAFVVRADGSVISKTSMKQHGAWGRSFYDVKLNPGDTLLVPEKVLRPTAMRAFMDYTQIFSSLALGAAAIAIIQ